MYNNKFCFTLIILLLIGSSVWAGPVITIDALGAVRITFPGTINYEIGASVASAGDFNGDGYRDAIIGAPSFEPVDFGNEYNNGAVFIVSGAQLNRDRGEIDLSSNSFDGVTIMGRFESRIGSAVDCVKDVNGDGFDDIVIGSAVLKTGYIIFGSSKSRRLIPINDLNESGVVVTHTGFSVAGAGDFNGDGFSDVLFGNPKSQKIQVKSGTKETEYDACRVTVIYGNSQLPAQIDSRIPSDNTFSIREIAGTRAGQKVCGDIDIDADGLSDIVIVASKGGADNKGRAFLIKGRESVDTAEYDIVIDHADRFVKNAGDVNGDGFPDLLIGMEDQSVFLLWGGKDLPGKMDLHSLTPEMGTVIKNANNSVQIANGVGDVNGDGYADIAIGLPMDSVRDKVHAGRVIFLFGGEKWPDIINTQPMCIGELSPVEYVVVEGTQPFGAFGASIAGLGDIQGDGLCDVIIGAPVQALPGESPLENPGIVYVIQGKILFQSLLSNRSLLFSREEK